MSRTRVIVAGRKDEVSRCRWYVVGKAPCGRPATHVHYIARRDDEEFYLCAYHATRARRDGWKPVYRIPMT